MSGRSNHNKCLHLENVAQLSLPELCKSKQGHRCSECDANGPNLWICLYKSCLHIGCSEQFNDHSTKHFNVKQQHCIHMNLSSQRIWCYLCETEVFLKQRRSSLISNDSSDAGRYSEKFYERTGSGGVTGIGGESPETSSDEEDGERRNLSGLVGLQNIANTCYMNAALQALSNSPPLTNYFLECGDIIETTSEINQGKPGLAKSYHRLIKEMWGRNKRSNGYVVPRGILYGIRNVHPMFRGFQQHDTQEFLRCFMDQLHEELKEVTPPPPDVLVKSEKSARDDVDQSPCPSPSPSQSEAEYETCDSGVSEQSSLSDEVSISARGGHAGSSYSRSPSPTPSQRTTGYSTAKQFSNQNSSSNPSSGGERKKDQSPPKPPHRSIISEVFDGKLLSSVQCLTCDRVSTREETFQDLSLPIPGKDHLAVLHQSQGITNSMPPPPPPNSSAGSSGGVTCTDAVYQAGQDGWFWWIWNWFRAWFWGPAVSLHDCMAAFFSADELKGDNMYSCEKCNKLRNGIKFSRVLALPEMLCVHLKRFRHDLSYSSKISSPVNFPLTGLDMRPYLHKDCKSEISTYDLTAVICHHGTVGGGHYTSFAKHELSGKWFEFDDQLVTEVTPEVVQNCQAYVLFYRKSNPLMALIRDQASELESSNPAQASDIQFYVSRQWISRFNTFAEPGPIDNWALLCPHGGLPPCKAAIIGRLTVSLPQPLWDFLYKKFGGGPACNHLFECDTCRRAAESLSRRQRAELEAFTLYNDEFQYHETPTTIFAISMAWLRQWQLFARGVTSEEPGPINNTSIAAMSDTQPIRNVRPGSDYAQINTTLWKFFHGIYGGGPEIILRGGPSEDVKLQHKEREFVDRMDVDIEKDTNIDIVVEPESETALRPVTGITSSQTQNNNQPKASKNVSFEDEADCSIERHSSGYESHGPKKESEENSPVASIVASAISSAPSSISDSVISTLKRSKHYSVNSASSNSSTQVAVHVDSLLGKKDKKYRGMKASGLFGPEGKYFTQSNILSEPAETTETTINNLLTLSTSNYPKQSPNPNLEIQNINNTDTSAATVHSLISSSLSLRSTEEVIPLLHYRQASVPSKIDQQIHQFDSEICLDMPPPQNGKISAQSSGASHGRKLSSKGLHRKKYKSKNGRKSHSHTQSHSVEVNCSDSG